VCCVDYGTVKYWDLKRDEQKELASTGVKRNHAISLKEAKYDATDEASVRGRRLCSSGIRREIED
jgi:hypothetical protein